VNPGELKDKLFVLILKRVQNTYTWESEADIWSKAEWLKGNNIFSSVGIGAKSIKFTIRKKSNLSLNNAFLWQGKHYFLTDIIDIDRMYYEVTAALIEPRSCIVERTGEPSLNELNRTVYEDNQILTFPGCLTEKYLRYTQGEPMASTETRYVIVTPKPIELVVGEIVIIDNIAYTVIIPHTLDEYKNEYEISVKVDA
jgi:hypothetical protein